MADIMMCNNQDCPIANNCYRFTAPPDRYDQSYIHNPKSDCEDDNLKLYISNEVNE